MPEQTLDEIELRSEEVQEVLTKVPHWMIRWGSLLFFVLILLILFLSYIIKYPDVIYAKSMVTTQKPPEKIYAKINEKLEIILVNDNDEVDVGQPLAVLKNNANYKDVFYIKAITDTLVLRTQNFNFPFDKLPVLALGDLAGDFAVFENSYSAYQLNKELRPFDNDSIANELSLFELENRLENTIAQKKINYRELVIKEKNLKRQRALYKKGVISAQEFENQRLLVLQAQKEYRNLHTTISQIKEAIAGMDRTSKSTTIDRTKEEIALYKTMLQSYNIFIKGLKTWELQYLLKSDTAGKVIFLDFWSPSQTVNSGDLVFTVIPNESNGYIAKLKAPIQNSGKVAIGQKVHIKLDNYPEEEYGVLNGTVQNISAIPNEEGLILIDVTIPGDLVTSYHKKIQFTQEMQGQAEIITEDLRLIERFFYQFRDLVSSRN